MFIDCESYQELNRRAGSNIVSPGYICDKYGISRQVVHNWIKRDVINAYRYQGKEGYFIFIPLTEIEKVYETRIKKILKKRLDFK